jgi:hypothetical protein
MLEPSHANDAAPRPADTGSSRRAQLIRSTLIALIALGALVGFALELHGHYPIQKWLFWKYSKAALYALFWLLSCVATGLAIVQRLTPGLPIPERLVQATAVGVYTFYLLQFLGGIAGWFGPVWAIVLPLLMLASGLAGSRGQLRELWHRRGDARSFVFGASAWWHGPILFFGIACLALLYLSILAPANANFDSQWYHLGLGQGWASDGAILRSPEGWIVEALPNMAAMLYSWSFLLPGLDLFEVTMVVAHQEFLLFAVTLASIPVLVHWMLPGTNAAIGWVALFLFPSVFIYDAGLHSGNDHIAAFWAVPIFLAMTRAWERVDWRNMLVFTVCAAGALLTKYQALSIVLGPGLFLLGRAFYLAIKRGDDSSWKAGIGVSIVAALLLTAPHWAKNWLWYGDPLYPALHKYLSPRPWNEDMPAMIERAWKVQLKRPTGTFVEQLVQTLIAGFDFSFRAFTKGRFHGHWPYFGSLFTLSLLWLPFVKGAKRTWAVAAVAQLGVFTWFYLSHVERYLQALIPLMAAVVVAAIALAWRTGWMARVPIVALLLLQVVWGGDAFFLRSHAMLREMPFVRTARLIESGFKGKWELRESAFGTQRKVGDALPPGSTVLAHGSSLRVGYGAQVVTDLPGYQAGIRYGLLDSPQAVWELYRDLGVDHLVWTGRKKSDTLDTIAGNLRFHEYVNNAIPSPANAGSLHHAPLPPTRPEATSSNVVLYAGCGSTFEQGFHRLRDMNVYHKEQDVISAFKPIQEDKAELDQAIEEASFIVYDPKCKTGVQRPGDEFLHAADYRGEQLWIRRWR